MQPKITERICIVPGNAQHIGSRSEQQDAFYFSDFFDSSLVRDYGVLAVLADGMGGHDMGGAAAGIAVAAFADEYFLTAPEDSVQVRLGKAIEKADFSVSKFGLEAGIDTGSTLIAAVVKDGLLYWIYTGDSRIYLWRNDVLVTLTSDYTYARKLEKLVLSGNISEDEAMNDPKRNCLISYIGVRDNLHFSVCNEPVRLKQGDKVLLCSDGLYGTLSNSEIAGLMHNPPQEAAELLLAKTLEKNIPHQDNVTILVIGNESVNS